MKRWEFFSQPNNLYNKILLIFWKDNPMLTLNETFLISASFFSEKIVSTAFVWESAYNTKIHHFNKKIFIVIISKTSVIRFFMKFIFHSISFGYKYRWYIWPNWRVINNSSKRQELYSLWTEVPTNNGEVSFITAAPRVHVMYSVAHLPS
jgi:hypothetical protein